MEPQTNQITAITTSELQGQQLSISRATADKSIAAASRALIYTPADCFNPAFLTVGQLRKNPDTRSQIADYIKLLIIQTNKFLGLVETMGETQVELTIDLILTEFPNLNVADLKLAFKNGMSRKYGKNGGVFSRLDGGIICEWLREYWAERLEVAEKIAYQKHKELKAAELNLPPMTEEGIKTMYDNYRKWDAENAPKIKKEEEDRENTQRIKAAAFAAQQEIDKIPAPNFNGMTKEETEKAQAEHKNQRFEILKKYAVA